MAVVTTPTREQQDAFVEACITLAGNYRTMIGEDASYPLTLDAPSWMVGTDLSWIDVILDAHHITLLEPTR